MTIFRNETILGIFTVQIQGAKSIKKNIMDSEHWEKQYI
jgi:hypothetical protein